MTSKAILPVLIGMTLAVVSLGRCGRKRTARNTPSSAKDTWQTLRRWQAERSSTTAWLGDDPGLHLLKPRNHQQRQRTPSCSRRRHRDDRLRAPGSAHPLRTVAQLAGRPQGSARCPQPINCATTAHDSDELTIDDRPPRDPHQQHADQCARRGERVHLRRLSRLPLVRHRCTVPRHGPPRAGCSASAAEVLDTFGGIDGTAQQGVVEFEMLEQELPLATATRPSGSTSCSPTRRAAEPQGGALVYTT